MDKSLLTEKYNLVNSPEYKRIKQLQIEHILTLSNSGIEPVILKGMLKLINDTDAWDREFHKERNKQNKE